MADKEHVIEKVVVNPKQAECSIIDSSEVSADDPFFAVQTAVESCIKINFYVTDGLNVDSQFSGTSAYDKLMSVSRKIRYPTKKVIKSGQDELYNNVIDILEANKCGFYVSEETAR